MHRRCLQFLLGQLEIPKRNFTQWLLDAKFWGVSEMYYGQCENDGLSLSIKTDYEVKHFFGMKAICQVHQQLELASVFALNLSRRAAFISLRMAYALFFYGMK